MEGDNIIGMYDMTGGGAISLEPGGQFELSGAPVENVHQTAAELMAHLAQVREVAKPLGIGFLGLGMTPNWTRADMPVMPKGRYKIMTNYMPKVGRFGLDMMYRTCTVQANLDFASKPTWSGSCACRSRCSRWRPRCSPIRLSPRVSRTVFSRSVPISGATPTMRAPACCPGRSRTAWASRLRRLRARRADVFRQARRQIHRRVGQVVPRFLRRQAGGDCRASGRRSPTGPII